ncbi:MAG: PAS domain S-box protein [Desulfobacterales bacterium]
MKIRQPRTAKRRASPKPAEQTMFEAPTVIGVFCLYMAGLFCIARWAEKKSSRGFNPANSAAVYSLTLAVYCTTWSFYGSVGSAAESGRLFLTITIGPTLSFALGTVILRRLVHIKNRHRITSIADFISARYGKSQLLAALATLICLIGAAPYIALQLRAVNATFAIIAESGNSSLPWIGEFVGPIVVTLMIAFTNLFGVRRLDPTERHSGVMLAVAVESLVKLAAFLAAGIFVTYYVHDGFSSIITQVSDRGFRHVRCMEPMHAKDYVSWASLLLLSMSAVFFLPRQFHVAVVENFHEKHIRTAMWLFPLYLVLMSLFIWPVAMGGLLLGFPAEKGDTFPLLIPFAHGHRWLSLFVFIGGFSAATGMIMVSSMTLSTMVTNHLLFPAVSRYNCLGFLRPHLLKCRWVAVTLIIVMGYCFEKILGENWQLVNIGLISFAASLQFAPVVLGGIFWIRGSRTGALAGLSAGFFIWIFTLLMPAVAKGGMFFADFPQNGLWGLAFLRPENLFGLSVLDPLSHSVFWSLCFNIFFYMLGSVCFRQSAEEQALAADFAQILPEHRHGFHSGKKSTIVLSAKKTVILGTLEQYFRSGDAVQLVEECLEKSGIREKKKISIDELAQLYGEVEKVLSGAVGAATAHVLMEKAGLFSPAEAEQLSALYGEILAGMKITPEELRKKILYYEEKEVLLKQHAHELEITVREREQEIVRRKEMEEELRRSEKKYRDLFESAPDGVLITTMGGKIVSFNRALMRMFHFADPAEVFELESAGLYANPEEERPVLLNTLKTEGSLSNYRIWAKDKNGRHFPASLSVNLIHYEDSPCIQAIVRDITEIRKMENRLKRYTENLEQMVEEKTRELTAANINLSAAVTSLEETRKQLAVSAHQAGMAEMAVSVLHNIGNAINSVNVRICGMEKHLPEKEVRSLQKILDQFRMPEMRPGSSEADTVRWDRLLSFFALTVDIFREKNNMFRDDLAFLRKGLDHVMEIIAIQQKYAGVRGMESLVDLNDIIRDAAEMLSDSIVRRGIQTEFIFKDIPLLFLDRNKMIQNFINIFKNAYESLDMVSPEKEKRICVITGLEKNGEGEYVQAVIADTGMGISPEIQKEVFRFNFSTKGRETGFGLHDTANYIRAQGGEIEIFSEGTDKGAQVVIRLPIPGGEKK